MKVHLVNISATMGGVIADCLKTLIFGVKLKEINYDAMKIFLAGGVSGNIRKFWTQFAKGKDIEEAMRIYIAGDNGKKKILSDKMNLYLAGTDSRKEYLLTDTNRLRDINILESFYYLQKNPEFMKLVPQLGSFLLDSGAFTFMSGSHKGAISWDKYVEDYAAFINRYDVKLFFELDIDSLVGLSEVERLRSKLEVLTGKKPIPVWHKTRGKDYFIKMCREYPYVAVGGIVTKEIPREIYEKAFPWFIKTAHENDAKIHGLGYTSVANLKKYRFDSVDSTAWLYGNRGGYLYKFNPKTGLIDKIESGMVASRLKNREGAVHNFNEWVKFGIYANRHL